MMPPPSLSASPASSLSFSNLDPVTAKQMAALQATSMAKAGNRSAPGGMTSASYFGALSTHQSTPPDSTSTAVTTAANTVTTTADSPAFPSGPQHPAHPAMLAHGPPQGPPQSPHPAMQQQRKKSFLNGLASVMHQRGVPLPPQITGVPYPSSFDPSTSPWRSLDFSTSDIGVVRLAGKDVDLFKLWALVQQAGGSAKINEQNLWGQLLPHLDLPEQFLQSNGQPQATAVALRHYYNNIIGPFEEAYRRNMASQHRALQGRTQPGIPMPAPAQGRPAISGMSGTFPPVGTLPAVNGITSSGIMPQTAAANALQPPDPSSLGGINGVQPFASQALPQTQQISQLPTNGINGAQDPRSIAQMDGTAMPLPATDSNGSLSDLDGDGRKRKIDDLDDPNNKRVRQRTGEPSDPRGSVAQPVPNAQPSTMNLPPRIRQPSRRKIIYAPLAREVDTAGGRDLDAIQQEFAHASQRPIKDLSEWGTVDVEALTMSIRSRISTELSYALTTFTILTLVRGKDASFPISQAPDLFEELLDLVEDLAFDGPEGSAKNEVPYSSIMTHRQLLNIILDEGSNTFSGLNPKQGLKEPSSGPHQRPGDIILAVTNIIRNLSLAGDNHDYMGRHDRLLGLMLRLCSLRPCAEGPTSHVPLSAALSLNDVVTLRRDTVYTLINIANAIHLSSSTSSPTAAEMRITRRAFELFTSYFIDSSETMGPYALLHLMGASTHPSHIHTHKPPSMIDSALEAFTRLSHSDDNRMVFAKAIPSAWLWSTIEALVHRLPVDNVDFQVLIRAEWLAYLERVLMSFYSIAFFAPPMIKKRVKTDRQLSFTKIMLRLIKKLSVYAPPDARTHFLVSLRRGIEALKLIDDAGDSFDASSPATMPTLAFGMGYGEHGEARVEKGMGLLSGYQEEITWGLMTQRDVDEQTFAELVSLVRVEPTT